MKEQPVTPQTETAPISGVTETQHSLMSERGSAKVAAIIAVGALGVGACGVLGVELLLNRFNVFSHMKDGLTTTPTVDNSKVTVTIDPNIEPVTFEPRTLIQANVKNSEALFKIDGFYRAPNMKEGHVMLMTGLPAEATTIANGPVDPTTHVVAKTVKVDATQFETLTYLPENANSVVMGDPSDFAKRTNVLLKDGLITSAETGDYILDGACKILSFGHCDKGVPNPFDAAVQRSKEDDALSVQALRVSVAKATEQCAEQEFTEEKKAVVESIKKQYEIQGIPSATLTVEFVDNHGVEITPSFVPDYSKHIEGFDVPGNNDKQIEELSRQFNITCGTGNMPVTPQTAPSDSAIAGGN